MVIISFKILPSFLRSNRGSDRMRIRSIYASLFHSKGSKLAIIEFIVIDSHFDFFKFQSEFSRYLSKFIRLPPAPVTRNLRSIVSTHHTPAWSVSTASLCPPPSEQPIILGTSSPFLSDDDSAVSELLFTRAPAITEVLKLVRALYTTEHFLPVLRRYLQRRKI